MHTVMHSYQAIPKASGLKLAPEAEVAWHLFAGVQAACHQSSSTPPSSCCGSATLSCHPVQHCCLPHLGGQLPGHADSLRLEVVPKAEVAQHLKEAVMPGGDPHILQVIGAYALLGGRCSSMLTRCLQAKSQCGAMLAS